MKISIITVSFNSAATIHDTLVSVTTQTYPDIEYIIIDGNSVDGTLEIINRFKDRISIVRSEKDKGIYDAMNKGIALATGEVIGILNSDDFYLDQKVIQKVINAFEHDTDAVYGDLVYVDPINIDKVTRKWLSGKYKEDAFLRGWMPPHPTFFVRKKIYEKFGNYSLELRSAADYEFMLRVIHKHKIKLNYIPEILVKMRAGGTSNASFKNRLKANSEDRKAWQMNQLKPRLFTFIRKPLSKVFQFINR